MVLELQWVGVVRWKCQKRGVLSIHGTGIHLVRLSQLREEFFQLAIRFRSSFQSLLVGRGRVFTSYFGRWTKVAWETSGKPFVQTFSDNLQ